MVIQKHQPNALKQNVDANASYMKKNKQKTYVSNFILKLSQVLSWTDSGTNACRDERLHTRKEPRPKAHIGKKYGSNGQKFI